jgi:hypothetical protein
MLHTVNADAEAAQVSDRRVCQRTPWHSADHRGLVAERGEAHSNVCFGSSDMNVEVPILEQQLAARRRQPQQ